MTSQVYEKIATVIAEQVNAAGSVETPEGVMRYSAGDYLVTDNPPTHIWPVKKATFESTYMSVRYTDDDEDNKYLEFVDTQTTMDD